MRSRHPLLQRSAVRSHVRAYVVFNLVFWIADRVVGDPAFGWAPTVGGLWAILLGLHLWVHMLSEHRGRGPTG